MKHTNTRKVTALLLSVVVLSGALFIYTRNVLSKQVTQDEQEASSLVTYVCNNNQKIIVNYDNANRQEPKATVTFKEITTTMKTVVSGSGARYSDGTNVWWSKGNTGFLMEAKDGGKILIDNCVDEKAKPVI